jgi:hypothetical protein
MAKGGRLFGCPCREVRECETPKLSWQPSARVGTEDARAWCRPFFRWYNHDHRHAGLGLLTPAVVHSGQAEAAHAARQAVLTRAYARHPERFVRRPPAPPPLPTAAWINPPPRRSVPAPPSSPPPSPLALATVGPVSNSLLFVSQTS